jgi:glycosyltransferase involved in cell wall biosynthesis
LIPLKAVHLLVRALSLIRHQLPTAHLRLVGPCDNPAYLKEIQRIAIAEGVADYVTVAGPRHGAELRAEYAAAVVVALPSLQENAPMVVAEAMAVGRPVVASRVGGVPELVADGTTGLLCTPGDVDGLARALVELLSHTPTQRRMGLAARVIAEQRFRLDRIVAQHQAVYERLAGMPAGAPPARRRQPLHVG